MQDLISKLTPDQAMEVVQRLVTKGGNIRETLLEEAKSVLESVDTDEIADEVVAAMNSHPLGKEATIIGRIVAEHPGMVVSKTGIGGSRVVDLPTGELLPRIC